MEAQFLIVTKTEEGMRLDRWLRVHFPKLGQSLIEKLCRKGAIRSDQGKLKPNSRVASGQKIRIPEDVRNSPAQTPGPRPAKVPQAVIRDLEARILFKDDDLLVLNKPSGLAVQGGSKTTTHVDAVLPHLTFGAPETPRLVHRLDRDTSGLLLLARNRATAQALTRAFARHDIQKTYWALVFGKPKPTHGLIDLALAKRPAPMGGERMRAVSRDDPDGLRARTGYALVAPAGSKFSWMALRPLTGRTHQLRAHMAALGTPIVGDPKYKVENERTVFGGIIEKKLHLHARSVSFRHPSSGKAMLIQAPLTDHMLRIWSHFGFDQADAVDAFGDSLG